MKWHKIIDVNSDVLDVFGSFDILNQIPLENHPEFYRFCRIASNYTKMKRISEMNSDMQLSLNFKTESNDK